MHELVLPEILKQLLPVDLQEAATGRLARKGENLFSAGAAPQWMFFVVSGEVVLERVVVHGEGVILQRSRRGFVSEASLMVQAYHCNAYATEQTQLIVLPVISMRQALERDSSFSQRWMRTLNAEIMRLRRQCERLSLHSVSARLIHLIETEGEQGCLSITTGIKTLAHELGVSHEALYRAIAELKKQGVLERTPLALQLKRAGSSPRSL